MRRAHRARGGAHGGARPESRPSRREAGGVEARRRSSERCTRRSRRGGDAADAVRKSIVDAERGSETPTPRLGARNPLGGPGAQRPTRSSPSCEINATSGGPLIEAVFRDDRPARRASPPQLRSAARSRLRPAVRTRPIPSARRRSSRRGAGRSRCRGRSTTRGRRAPRSRATSALASIRARPTPWPRAASST